MQSLFPVLLYLLSVTSHFRGHFVPKPIGSIGYIVFLGISLHQTLSQTDDSKPFNFYYLPAVKEEVYSQLGDINIGDMADISGWRDPGRTCANSIEAKSSVPEGTEPTKFAVDMINRNPALLPNVTIGFIIRGACPTIPMKMAVSLLFLPRTEKICKNGTDCVTQQMTSTSGSKYISHDVIAMLAPIKSNDAAAVSSMFTIARLPVVGFKAGSHELGYKQFHPYFYRVNSQDKHQIRGILKFASSKGWTYIQMVFRDEDYGRDAYKFMHMLSSDYGVCIAGSYRLGGYKYVATSLLLNPLARAVVLFFENWRFKHLLREIERQNGTGHFIWIGSDRLDRYQGYHSELSMDPGIGAFIIHPSSVIIPEYYDYVRNIDPLTSKNPWLKYVWQKFQSCSYSEGTCNPDVDILNTSMYIPHKSVSLRIDAILTIAHAAHNLLRDRCPNARGKEARACITGELLRQYIENVNFEGYNGRMEMDGYHTVNGNFTIHQLKFGYVNGIFGSNSIKRMYDSPVAIYVSSIGTIRFLNEEISWSHLNPVERIIPWSNDSVFYDIPESVCSRPCIVGEYKIEKDLPCCWDCLRCRDNERLIGGNTGCEACPLLTWPDPMSDFTTCIDIPPTYQTMQDTIPIVLISVAVFAILLTILIFSAYIKYRNERVVKASSRELSIIQLIGIVTGYTTVILFQTKPTHTMCRTIFFVFCMSFALLYCPLLVKTIRIVRIFKSAAKNQQPKFISPQSQLIVAIWLIVIQMLLCGAIFVLYIPGAQRTQPIWSEKMVELSCDLTLPGLASFLGYNIFLVCLCSVFAFMVRKLPDNYNESRFISMCVSTTLLIWMAFIPTYFTAGREYIRMFLLCMALILNHSVALTLLFLPKLYAAKFLNEGALNFAVKKS